MPIALLLPEQENTALHLCLAIYQHFPLRYVQSLGSDQSACLQFHGEILSIPTARGARILSSPFLRNIYIDVIWDTRRNGCAPFHICLNQICSDHSRMKCFQCNTLVYLRNAIATWTYCTRCPSLLMCPQPFSTCLAQKCSSPVIILSALHPPPSTLTLFSDKIVIARRSCD